MGIVNGAVTFGTFSAVWQLIGQITGPAIQFSGILPQYYTMTASIDRLKELEALAGEENDTNADWQKANRNFAAIHCEKLIFSYDNNDQNTVLRDMTFTINWGDFIAITGTSGVHFLKAASRHLPPPEVCYYRASGG